jgi:PST family polysaccharide transporter
MVFIDFGQRIAFRGIGTFLIRHQNPTEQYYDTAFWLSIALGIFLCIGLIIGASLGAQFLNQPALAEVLRWLSPLFLLKALVVVQQVRLMRRLEFKVLAIRSGVAAIVGGVVGVAMALAGLGMWSLVAQQLTTAAIGVAVLWAASSWRPRLRISAAASREAWTFSRYVVATHVTLFVNQRSDLLIIGAFLGPGAVGVYAIGQRITLIMAELFISALGRVALPAFARLQNRPERLAEAYYAAVRFTAPITFPAFVGLACIASELVRFLLSDQWLGAVPVIQLFALVGALQSLRYWNGMLYVTLGRPDWQFRLAVLDAVTSVLAMLLAVRWGITAVATAIVLRSYVLYPLSVWLLTRLVPVKPLGYMQRLVEPILASGIMAATLVGARPVLVPHVDTAGALAVLVGLGTVIYTISLGLLAPQLRNDLIMLLRALVARDGDALRRVWATG